MGSYSKLTYHIVFGTKYRRKTISSEIAPRLYEYVGGIIRDLSGSQIEIGGIEDHIHILTTLPASNAISKALQEIKASSSKWMKENSSQAQFAWQVGYGAFTVSYSGIDTVRSYIQNQREHHRMRTFEEEYEQLLLKHGIAYKNEHLFEGEHAG